MSTPPHTQEQAPSVIHAGLHVRGRLAGAEELHVAGTLEGELTLDHHLSVHAGGQVHGKLQVESAAVAGAITGAVTAMDYVILHQGARVEADVKAPRVILEPGSHFRGRIEMDVPLPDGL
jgi:cytoskeletal protein CcmA (bactofilin family)